MKNCKYMIVFLCCILITACGKKGVINEDNFGVLESSVEETEDV